jgi:Leucine-rich repeat (LRR) protein
MIKELTREIVERIYKDYPRLQELNLSSNEIAAVQHLGRFKETLRKLNLSNNSIKSLSSMPVQGVEPSAMGVSLLINLVELNLSGNRLITLDGLDTLQALLVLDLSNNQIASITEVYKLQKNKQLTVLMLAGNPISSKA